LKLRGQTGRDSQTYWSWGDRQEETVKHIKAGRTDRKRQSNILKLRGETGRDSDNLRNTNSAKTRKNKPY
jgi:hypothetical protein